MSRWSWILPGVLTVLYFAYGSDMSWTQMRERCPGARFRSVSALRDHRLAFTRTSERWQGGGVADVVPDSGHVVWGVVYELQQADLDSLDRFEGYREGVSDNACTRQTAQAYVRGRSTRPQQVWIYRAARPGAHFAPSAAYRDTLLSGARLWKLPELYVEDLERIEAAR